MEASFLLFILLSLLAGLIFGIVKLLLFSIRRRKNGGIVTLAGLFSLIISSVYRLTLEVRVLVYDNINYHSFWAPEHASSYDNNLLIDKINSTTPWIIGSAIVLVIGLIWLALELVMERRRRKTEQAQS